MSFMQGAKEFFGFTPDTTEYDTYYDEPQYNDDRAAGYAADTRREPAYARTADTVVREPRAYTPSIVVVEPRTFDDAKDIGEPFRDGDAVIMELSGLDKTSRTRFVDFSSGLCLALRGKMYKLNAGDTGRIVFSIVPEEARITKTELERTAGLR